MPYRNWQDLLDSLLLKASKDGTFRDVEKIYSEEELIAFFLKSAYKNDLLEWIRSTNLQASWKKCKSKAQLSRNEGNRMFQKGNYASCVYYYTESMKFAPKGSEEMPLSFANRSAALFHLKNYESAINDIELAFYHGYPHNLQYKLHQRKGDCLTLLERFQEAVTEYGLAQNTLKCASIDDPKKSKLSKLIEEALASSLAHMNIDKKKAEGINVPKLPTLVGGENEELANASKVVHLKKNSKKGRYVIANTNISVGDILFVENPFAFVLLPEHYRDRCHHCCEISRIPVPCEECTLAMYCSENCRKESWTEYHKWECFGGLNIAHSVGIAHLGLRIVLKAGSLLEHKRLKSKLRESDVQGIGQYFSVYHLLTHLENMSVEDRTAYSLTALCLVLHLFHNTDYFLSKLPCSSKDVKDIILIGSLILHHLCQVVCNGHAISVVQEIINEDSEFLINEKEMRIATAIFPSASMMNHSCDPNIINSFSGTSLIVKAYKDIKKGQEVFNCYGPDYRRMCREERRKLLAAQYYFECECDACTSKNDYLERFTAFLCKTCHNPLVQKQEENQKLKCQECGSCFASNEMMAVKSKANDLLNTGQQFIEKGLVKEALQHFQSCRSLQETCLFTCHIERRICLDEIARCYALLGDYYTSALHLLETFPAIKEQFGVWSVEMGYEVHKLTDLLISDLKTEASKKIIPRHKYCQVQNYLQMAKKIFQLHYGPWNSTYRDVLQKERALNVLISEVEISS